VDVGSPLTIHLKRDGLAGAKLLPRPAVDDITAFEGKGVVFAIGSDAS